MRKQIHEILFTAFVTLLVLAGAAYVHAITKFPEEKFVGQISILNLDFSQLDNFQDATNYLHEVSQNFLTSKVTWTSERGKKTLSMAEMGVDLHVDELENYLTGFMDSANDWEKIQIYFFGKAQAYPELSIDAEMLKRAFSDSGIEQGNMSASYSYENNQVVVVSEQIGYGIDETAITKLIESYWIDEFTVPQAAQLPLRTSTPEIRQSTLEALLPQAQILAEKALSFQDEFGNEWGFKLNEHMDLVVPDEQNQFVLSEQGFSTYIDETLAPEIEEDPQMAKIIEEEDGSYDFEGSARFGKAIFDEEFKTLVEEHLHSNNQEPITIPIYTIDPIVIVPDSLREKGVKELIGYGYTNYYGSPYNRIYNINVGMDKFNGTIVEQGEEFSFTSIMGPIDGAHGWKEELVIKGDETIPEYGGGLCQVSTTMFRAALYNGLPITDRKNHSYAVSYYAYPNGYGLDATVYQYAPDLRFINDTPGALLIQGYTEDNSAYFVFYGTNDGRKVQMDGPYTYNYHKITTPVTSYTTELAPGERKLDEYAHTGFDVDWYRTIIYADGTESEPELIHSSYEARPEKWLEGITGGEEAEETTE